jgi:hypothetical protein
MAISTLTHYTNPQFAAVFSENYQINFRIVHFENSKNLSSYLINPSKVDAKMPVFRPFMTFESKSYIKKLAQKVLRAKIKEIDMNSL